MRILVLAAAMFAAVFAAPAMADPVCDQARINLEDIRSGKDHVNGIPEGEPQMKGEKAYEADMGAFYIDAFREMGDIRVYCGANEWPAYVQSAAVKAALITAVQADPARYCAPAPEEGFSAVSFIQNRFKDEAIIAFSHRIKETSNSYDPFRQKDWDSQTHFSEASYLREVSQVLSASCAPSDNARLALAEALVAGPEPEVDEAHKELMKVRPFVKLFSYNTINDFAGGDLCIATGWSGDYNVVKRRAKAAGRDEDIRFVAPRGQAGLWFTMMGIPKDAANKEAAYKWINFLLQPDIAAETTPQITYPSAVSAAKALVAPELASDPNAEHELRDWLGKAMLRLPADQRLVLELAYGGGHSLEEIAAIVQCPVGTIKARMFHARVKLRNLLPDLAGARPVRTGEAS